MSGSLLALCLVRNRLSSAHSLIKSPNAHGFGRGFDSIHPTSSIPSSTCGRLEQCRNMGGGPRTFPGGLSKWQWKRLHEKKARQKEKTLLQQDRQVYLARIRSQLRGKIFENDDDNTRNINVAKQDPSHGPMTPKDQIAALSDRFMKMGAEDLWNEDDGPLTSDPFPPPPSAHGDGAENTAEVHRWNNEKDSLKGSVKDSQRKYGSGSILFSRGFTARSGRSTGLDRGRRFSDEEYSGQRRSREFGREQRFSGDNDEYSDKNGDEENNSDKELIPAEFSKKVEPKHRGFNMDNRHPWNGEDESYLSRSRFDQCNISLLSLQALLEAGYVQMTVVQEATLPIILEGKDVLAKAKTGTGKTLAFLLPAIEVVVKTPPLSQNQRRSPIIVLVVCPTRELASQTAAETNTLLRYHSNIGVQVVVGGTRLHVERKRLETDPCQILVATPGRLLYHIDNTPGFSSQLMGLKVLILDEADHLLDLGFRKDIEKIIDAIPRQRQSLLFSATIPQQVHQILQIALKRDHAFINTVGLGCQETHAKVLQRCIVTSHENHLHVLYGVLKEHISEVSDYKVLVFCTTAAVTRVVYEMLLALNMNVREMHSRKTQVYRTRIYDEFRNSKCLILVTSDVSSRGVDYPDVTLVVQMGLPPDREQYIHRLGRTGRKGKEGHGLLLLAPWEEFFLADVQDLPIKRASLPEMHSEMISRVQHAIANVDLSAKEYAYHAWLGYYNSVKAIGRDKTRLVELANQFSHSIGLEQQPELLRKTAVKMGLKGIPGLRIKKK